MVKENSPKCLPDYSVCNTTSANQITLNTFTTRTETIKNSFFSHFAFLNLTKQSESIKKIKNILMKDIKSNEQTLFSIHGP